MAIVKRMVMACRGGGDDENDGENDDISASSEGQ
mgnify:CR=1 FL=1